MDVLERLLVTIEGSSALLRQELQKGNTAVAQFSRNTDRELGQANKGFGDFYATARKAFALFGIGFGARAFSGWIKGALDAKNMTQEQLEATQRAREALAGMRAASDDLGRSLGGALAPAIENVARSLEAVRKVLNPTDAEGIEKNIRSVEGEINRLTRGVVTFEEGSGGFWHRLFFDDGVIARSREEIEALRVKLDELYAARRALTPDTQGITEQEIQALNDLVAELNTPKPRQPIITDEERVALESFLYELNQREPLITQDELVALEQFVYQMNQREPFITQDEILALEEFLFALNQVPETLTQEEWIDLESFIYDLNHMQDEAAKVAASIGSSFRNSFVDWIVGAERDFSELLKRMAADMAASAIFSGLGTALGGSTSGIGKFFASFFGGSRANGGPVERGKGYLINDGKKPELFWPGVSGSMVPVASMGGGSSYHFETHIDARGADPSAVSRMQSSLDERERRLLAKVKHETQRRRL